MWDDVKAIALYMLIGYVCLGVLIGQAMWRRPHNDDDD